MRKAFGQAVVSLAIAATITTVPLAAPLGAQGIDPRVLQQVQGQFGSGPNAGDAVDRARDQGDSRQAANGAGIGADRPTRVDTREEQELRRAEARAGLARLYRPSPIERDFRERLADPDAETIRL